MHNWHNSWIQRRYIPTHRRSNNQILFWFEQSNPNYFPIHMPIIQICTTLGGTDCDTLWQLPQMQATLNKTLNQYDDHSTLYLCNKCPNKVKNTPIGVFLFFELKKRYSQHLNNKINTQSRGVPQQESPPTHPTKKHATPSKSHIFSAPPGKKHPQNRRNPPFF